MSVDLESTERNSARIENELGSTSEQGGPIPKPARKVGPLRRFLRLLGTGLITGASDDDPSGIGTYAVAGASLGFATLWTALATFPLMAAVQFICAKIGMVSGMGLAGVLRRHYAKAIL